MENFTNINTLIVPDVHGRDFWRTPVFEALEKVKDAEVVFLGDYLDPYPFDFSRDIPEEQIHRHALENLREIIAIKKQYPDRVHILFGNHDLSYVLTRNFCNCRHCYDIDEEARELFGGNIDLFDIAVFKNVGNTKYILSHAGITNFWASETNTDETKLDEDLHNGKLWQRLDYVSRYRGGWGMAGSIVWADINEHALDVRFKDYVQIFGHTKLNGMPIHYHSDKNEWYCLDCGKVFMIDGFGNVLNYDDASIIVDTDIE